MSMSKNIARLAVTAGLTAALSFGGVMAPVTMAFAAEGDNTITVTQNKDNATTKFKAYQIFKADVVDEGERKVVSNVEWASPKAQTAVLGVLMAEHVSGITDSSTAQEVADYLAQNVKDTTDTTRVDNSELLYKIADKVAKGVDQTGASFEANMPFTASSKGYYLFVTDTLDASKPNTGTSPIFALVGGSAVTVAEKTIIPTVEKKILNDGLNKNAENASDSDWGIVGDSQIGQEVDYKLTGTVADNIASYDKYEYEFQDTLSKGLVVAKDDSNDAKDLHVYIVNGNSKTEVKEGFTATVSSAADPQKNSELLKVSFEDLKTVKDVNGSPITVDKGSKVVVTYKAQLTSNASYEVAGNPNTVKLVYSNNPMAEGTGTSIEKTVTDHVFRLDVTKVDQNEPAKKLEAGFKVQVVENEDSVSVGRWLSEDGSLVDGEENAYEFKTDKVTGDVKIPGLDAGKYLITETATPAGYNTIRPFYITVTPSYDDQGNLTTLTAIADSDMVETNNATDATIPLTVKNKKGSGLPLTGLNGVTFTWIAGGAVLCIGVAHLIRSRKQAEESEQE